MLIWQRESRRQCKGFGGFQEVWSVYTKQGAAYNICLEGAIHKTDSSVEYFTITTWTGLVVC
jgi:hypothetical protein